MRLIKIKKQLLKRFKFWQLFDYLEEFNHNKVSAFCIFEYEENQEA